MIDIYTYNNYLINHTVVYTSQNLLTTIVVLITKDQGFEILFLITEHVVMMTIA